MNKENIKHERKTDDVRALVMTAEKGEDEDGRTLYSLHSAMNEKIPFREKYAIAKGILFQMFVLLNEGIRKEYDEGRESQIDERRMSDVSELTGMFGDLLRQTYEV